jgi:hypothetical protein
MSKATTIEDVILAPLDVGQVVDRSGLMHITPEMIDVRIGKQLLDSAFLSGIDAMANDHDDRALPSAALCSAHCFDSFTIAIAHVDAPLDPLAVIVLDIEIDGAVLKSMVHLVFTDAEVRGEGLSHLCSSGAMLILERIGENWLDMPNSEGDRPSRVEISGNAVSGGGMAVIDRIQSFADDILIGSEDFELSF